MHGHLKSTIAISIHISFIKRVVEAEDMTTVFKKGKIEQGTNN